MINGDVIAKNEMTVKDDVFNSIVNGIKTPIEKDVDIQKAEKSNAYLKGKQLQRFKQKIIPEFTKSFQNEGLIHDYVQASREEYEKLKVEEVKAAYEASVQEIKEVTEEVDEELEEIESDKKGFIYFLKKGWTIFKWVTRLIRFYAYYKKVMSTFYSAKAYSSVEKPKSFDWKQYDFEKQIDREQFVKDFSIQITKWTEYGVVKFFQPLLTHVTGAILAAADMAYRKINREIMFYVGKQIAIEAFEWIVALAMTPKTLGVSFIVKVGRTVDKIWDFFKSIFTIGTRAKKLQSLAKNVRKMRGAWYSADQLKLARKVNDLKNAKTIPENYKRINNVTSALRWADRAYDTTNAIFTIIDVVDVDREDVAKLREKTKKISKSLGDKAIAALEVGEGVVTDGLSKTFDKMVIFAKDTANNYKEKFLKKFVTKYKSQFEIKIFKDDKKDKEGRQYTFDYLMDAMGKLTAIFTKEYDIIKQNYFPFVVDENGWKIVFGGKTMSFRKTIVTLDDGTTITNSYINFPEAIKMEKYNNRVVKQIEFSINHGDIFDTRNDTINIGYLSEQARSRIRVRQPDGIKLTYDKSGNMKGVKLFIEEFLNSKWDLLKPDQKIKIKYNNNADKYVNVYFSKEINNTFIGIEKIQDTSPYKTKIHVGTIKDVEMEDLSEILNSRNEQLKQEQEFEQKTKLLKETIDKIVNV